MRLLNLFMPLPFMGDTHASFVLDLILSNFPMTTFNKWSMIDILSSGVLNSGNYSCHFDPLSRSLYFLNYGLNYFSSDDFILSSISSAVGTGALSTASSSDSSPDKPRSSCLYSVERFYTAMLTSFISTFLWLWLCVVVSHCSTHALRKRSFVLFLRE